jgi:hypothetical protein
MFSSRGLRPRIRGPDRGYCHLVVASMAVVMFGGMCKYDDASRRRRRDVMFEPSIFYLSFEKKKNAKIGQGNKITVVVANIGHVCPFKLLEMMKLHTGESDDAFVFRDFNGRLVK